MELKAQLQKCEVEGSAKQVKDKMRADRDGFATFSIMLPDKILPGKRIMFQLWECFKILKHMIRYEGTNSFVRLHCMWFFVPWPGLRLSITPEALLPTFAMPIFQMPICRDASLPMRET